MTVKEKKRIKTLWRNYKNCTGGKPANCNKCIGCAGNRKVIHRCDCW